MLSPVVDLYIRRKAKKEHRFLPENYKYILKEFAGKYCKNKVKVHYLWFWDAGGSLPNASATIPGVILINAVWAALLVERYNDETIVDAFKMTIGHELTHQENDYFFLEPFPMHIVTLEKYLRYKGKCLPISGCFAGGFSGNFQEKNL